MRWFFLLALTLLLVSCSQQGTKKITDTPQSRFIVSDKNITSILAQKLKANESHVVILNDNIKMKLGDSGEIVYAVKNPLNGSDICIYSQFICSAVLRGDTCDNEIHQENTGYFWRWFTPDNKILVMNSTSVYLKAFITKDNTENDFLGEIIVWYSKAENGKCPEIEVFGEKENVKELGKAEFLLSISSEDI